MWYLFGYHQLSTSEFLLLIIPSGTWLHSRTGTLQTFSFIYCHLVNCHFGSRARAITRDIIIDITPVWFLMASVPMTIYALSDGTIPLIRPCVDCGRSTHTFCSGGVSSERTVRGEDGELIGTGKFIIFPMDQCFAKKNIPSEPWNTNQRTPFCSTCESAVLFCRFCRVVPGCTPPSWK